MKLLKKRYLKLDIKTASSLSVGSGENRNTDHDLLVDSCGRPFIPGTAIAGVTRHALADGKWISKEQEEKFFGKVIINKETGDSVEKAEESRIVFYDAPLDAKGLLTERDLVALDRYKNAEKGKKFDMEILEKGATGSILIEDNISKEDTDAADILKKIASVWNRGEIRLGAKTERGFGEIEVRDVFCKEFDFTSPESIEAWLDFDPLHTPKEKWVKWNKDDLSQVSHKGFKMTLSLKQNGGISVRQYMTDVSEGEDQAKPDFAQMTLHSGEPVVPGTSWAGAFRHHMAQFLTAEDLKNSFGEVDEAKRVKRRSSVRFSESVIQGTKAKILSRNAINRFTGGTGNGALYTEKTYYDGETELVISWSGASAPGDSFKQALAAAVTDLDQGFLAVGGETSIGRGLFTVTGVNGTPPKNDGYFGAAELYNLVLENLGES